MKRFLIIVNATTRVVLGCKATKFLLDWHDDYGGLVASQERKNYMIVHDPPLKCPEILSIVMRTVVVVINRITTLYGREAQTSYTRELAREAMSRLSGTRVRMSGAFKTVVPILIRGPIHVTSHETVKIPRSQRALFY
jgi:hypothetical protein